MIVTDDTLAEKREAIKARLRAMDGGPVDTAELAGVREYPFVRPPRPPYQQHAFTVQAGRGMALFCRKCGQDRLFAESMPATCSARPDDVVRQHIDIQIRQAMDTGWQGRRRRDTSAAAPVWAAPQAWTTSAIAGGASWDLASESFRRAKAREAQAARNYPAGQFE